MTPGAIAASALGSVFASALAWYLVLVESGATGSPNIDPLRWQVALSLFTKLSPTIADMRAMMAILHNENGPDDPEIEGDLDYSAGPSIGPGKVYRKTATELGLWNTVGSEEEDRQAYTDFGNDPANESLLITWSVVVYLDKKKQAGGVIWGADGTVRRYNGGGDKARKYAASAATFASDTWGEA